MYNKEYYEAHKEQRKAIMKAYKEAHKDNVKSRKKAWREANKEKVKEYMKAWYEANKEKAKAYQKEYMKAWYEANKEKAKAYQKAYRQANKEKVKAYMQSDVNSLGQTKASIRLKSLSILKQMNLHIDGYEIHHAFGYNDASKFIYISKELHLKIHSFLRDNNIDADSDHWFQIRDLVNSTDEFIYIKC